MRRLIFMLAASALLLAAQRSADEFLTSAGSLKITPIQHASLMIEAGGQVVHVDPAQGDYAGMPKADIVLLTHSHGDHVNAERLAMVRQSSTVLIAPADVAKQVEGATVMANGDTKTVGPWTIEAVPAYNIPAEGKQIFHAKGAGNGYVLSYGGLRVYIAGDTEGVPEMRALKSIDVAFLPMNLPYTMTPEAAAEAAKAFQPNVVYPYHSRGQDTTILEKALAGTGIEVRLRNWYE